jgi:hypothetical protein
MYTKFWSENQKPDGKRLLGRPRLRWNVRKKFIGWCGLDSFCSWYCPMEDCCGHANKPSGSIKAAEFLY